MTTMAKSTAHHGNRIRQARSDRVFMIVVYSILVLLCLICLVPLVYILSTSFSSGSAIYAGKVFFWPVGFNTGAYQILLKTGRLGLYFMNSVEVTLVGTALSMAGTILCAYPLSKKYMIGRRGFSFYCIFTMLFGGGMIPTYLLVRNLGLLNTYWAVWLVGMISPYNMIILRSFFEGIPEELEEAAIIDGCGEWRKLFSLYLPLAGAAIATLTLFYAVGYWNTYQKVFLYINNTKKYTLPVYIQQMVFQLQQLDVDNPDAQAIAAVNDVVSEGVKNASIVVLVLPMLVVYPFIQKYFVKGVTIGAVKG